MNNKNRDKIKCAIEKGYYVDNNGNVFNNAGLQRKINFKHNGYPFFTIRDNYGKTVHILVHRLLAYQNFGDRIFKKNIVVRHLDGNPKNCTINNIAIGTQSENMYDIPKEKRYLNCHFN